ncbi:MAG: host-nuclease inhibitor Gam family protein [Sphingomonadales bacterium]|jgi:phage host-nuclease inhibitor protein Gam
MVKRMKSPARKAVTSLDELTISLGRWATLSAEVETHIAAANKEIAEVKGRLAVTTAPLLVEMKAIQKKAKPWWEANSDTLTGGDKKSVELAGCQIGMRLSNPKLGFPEPEEHAIALIEGQQWPGLIRVKKELDKPAILYCLSWSLEKEHGITAEEAAAVLPNLPPEAQQAIAEKIELRAKLAAFGFHSIQKEEFFLAARLGDKVESTVTVAEDADAQVAA